MKNLKDSLYEATNFYFSEWEDEATEKENDDETSEQPIKEEDSEDSDEEPIKEDETEGEEGDNANEEIDEFSKINIPTKTVSDIGDEFDFVSDSQDVEAIKEYIGNSPELDRYDSFFIALNPEGNDYSEVWGLQGIIPDLNKPVEKVYPVNGGQEELSDEIPEELETKSTGVIEAEDEDEDKEVAESAGPSPSQEEPPQNKKQASGSSGSSSGSVNWNSTSPASQMNPVPANTKQANGSKGSGSASVKWSPKSPASQQEEPAPTKKQAASSYSKQSVSSQNWKVKNQSPTMSPVPANTKQAAVGDKVPKVTEVTNPLNVEVNRRVSELEAEIRKLRRSDDDDVGEKIDALKTKIEKVKKRLPENKVSTVTESLRHRAYEILTDEEDYLSI